MSRFLTFIFVATLGMSTALAQTSNGQQGVPQGIQADTRALEQQLIDIEQQWGMAFVKRDPSALQRHVADDYVGTYPTRKLTKADLIAGAKGGGERTVLSFDDSKLKVRLFDKTAVVTGVAVQRVREKGGDISVFRTLYTEVFILRDGVWQCVAGHYTPQASPE